MSSGPGGGLVGAAAGAGVGVGVALLVCAVVDPGVVTAAADVLADAFCWFCLACALARLAADAMILAVVGHVEGSDPDAAAAVVAAGVGVDVDVGAGKEVIEGGIDIAA